MQMGIWKYIPVSYRTPVLWGRYPKKSEDEEEKEEKTEEENEEKAEEMKVVEKEK